MSINGDALIETADCADLVPTSRKDVIIKRVQSDDEDPWILQEVKNRRSFYAINIRESEKLKAKNAENASGEKTEELQKCIESRSVAKDARGKGVRKKWTFVLFDVTFCLVIASPLVVGYWMTAWSLMDLLISNVPGDVIFVGGLAIHLAIALFKSHLHQSAVGALAEMQDNLASRIFWKIKQIVYTYCFGIATILNWRGGWIVYDEYFLGKLGGSVYMTVIMTGTLAVFRSIRNLIITPTSLYVDNLDLTFDFPTRYRVVSSIRNFKPPNPDLSQLSVSMVSRRFGSRPKGKLRLPIAR